MPLRIGLCIAGRAVWREYRSTAALDEHVWGSQLRHLLLGLAAQGSLDTFFVLEAADAGEAEVLGVLRRFMPVGVTWVNSSEETAESRRTVPQYMKLAACADAFERAEARSGRRYDWTVRSRPDLYFYGGLPALDTLDAGAVHARMRCFHFGSNFTENNISAELHHVLRRGCGHKTDQCSCRLMRDCSTNDATRLDDQFALVPRSLMRTYFASHARSVHAGLSPTTRDVCPPLDCTPGGGPCRCTAGLACHARPECMLTTSVLAAGRAVPTQLYYCIARTRSAKWGSGSRLGRLFLDASLAVGLMDAASTISYRQSCPGRAPPPPPPPSPLLLCVDTKPVDWCAGRMHMRDTNGTRLCAVESFGRDRCAGTCGVWCTPGGAYRVQIDDHAEAMRLHKAERWVTRTNPFVYEEGITTEAMAACCTEVLHNPRWAAYRLNDMLNSRFFRHSSGTPSATRPPSRARRVSAACPERRPRACRPQRACA